MIPVFDRRKEDAECSLEALAPGQTFLWNDYLCVVVNTTGTSVQATNEEHILCMVVSSGQLAYIGRLAQVERVECEIAIIE